MAYNKIVMVCGLLLILIVLNGCNNNPNGTPVVDGDSSLDDIIMLDSGGRILPDACSARGLNDKIIMLESEYCGHCKVVRPILIEIGNEKGIDIIFLDVSDSEDRDRMTNEFHISIKYTPTLIVGCTVVIGSRERQEYEQMIDAFLEG